MDPDNEAAEIEMRAADRSYKAGLGVSEWDFFLKPDEVQRLKFLAKQGAGTWGRERKQQSNTN